MVTAGSPVPSNSPADIPVNLWKSPDVRRLVLVGTLAFSSFFLTLSSLPLWAVAGGASEGAAGLVTTVMLVVTVLTQMAVPGLVRRFGLAPVMAAGMVTLGGAAPLYLISHELPWLLAVSAIRGTGFAVITVLMPLIASAQVSPERRGEVIGIYGLAIAVPNLIGVPLGVALTSADQFGWVAVLGAAPLLALPLIPAFARTPQRTTEHHGEKTGLATTLRGLTGVTLVLLTVTVAGGGVLTFLPIARPDGALATTALLVFGLVAAVCRWGSGLLADRFGSRLLLPGTLAIAVVGMVLLGFGLTTEATAATVLILVGVTVFALGYGAVQNVTLLVAFNKTPGDRQATASAVWNGAYDAGTAVGALLIGMVAAAGAGYGWTYLGAAAVMLVALPLAIRAAR